MARHASIVGSRIDRPEIWASPEPTIARIDAAHVRDQLAESGHDRRASDLDRLADLGIDASRFPMLWERVAPRVPHERDFAPWVARAERLRDRGVDPIVTLLHHGSGPLYTDLLDPNFPALFADYAEAAAHALPWVRRWTPINEPLTTARFAGLYGLWYPNLRNDASFARVLLNEIRATSEAMARIRALNPSAEFVLTEDLQRFTAGDAGAEHEAAFLRERMFLSVELLTGAVVPGHPLFEYLRERCGIDTAELALAAARATPPNLMAFNHYPHSERYLFETPQGALGDVPAVYVAGESPLEVGPLLRGAAERLSLPLALGEVHVHAPEAERVRWLAQHADAVDALRADGLDIRAIGVWSAFGTIDWHSLLRERTSIAEDGIFTFAGPRGTPARTLVADAVAALVRGERIDDRGIRGWWERPERLRDPVELLAMRAGGIPEGEHVRFVDSAVK